VTAQVMMTLSDFAAIVSLPMDWRIDRS
jgi:hypothetical protein